MTYEEAIKNINALNAVCGQKGLYDAEFESALALAILALEKQIPKKLKDDGWLYCPICGRDVLMDKFNYCPDCGQALDWSDDNA